MNSANMTLPANASIDNIFGSILRGRFTGAAGFDDQVVSLAAKLTQSTIEFWDKIKSKMLPTPATFHYTFNMRDLSRVFQGVMLPPNDVFTSSKNSEGEDVPGHHFLCRLWKHE